MALRQLAPRLVQYNAVHFADLCRLQTTILSAAESLDHVILSGKVPFGTAASGRPPFQSIALADIYRKAKPIEYKAESAGMVGDPYKGPRRWITPLDLFHPTGWKQISSRLKNTAINLYSLYLCRKHLEDFKLRTLKKETFEVYKTTSEAFAAGNVDLLRKLVTTSLLSEMKKEMTLRKSGGWHKIHWSLNPEHPRNKVKFLQARVLGIPNNKFTPSFVQLTFLFKNKQQFAAFDRRGKLKAGSKDEEIDVEDYWVFERLLNKESLNSKWRVAARLQITQ